MDDKKIYQLVVERSWNKRLCSLLNERKMLVLDALKDLSPEK